MPTSPSSPRPPHNDGALLSPSCMARSSSRTSDEPWTHQGEKSVGSGQLSRKGNAEPRWHAALPLAPQRCPQPETTIPTAVSAHISLRGAQWHRGHTCLAGLGSPAETGTRFYRGNHKSTLMMGVRGKVQWGGDARRLTPRAELPWSAVVLEMCIFRPHLEPRAPPCREWRRTD